MQQQFKHRLTVRNCVIIYHYQYVDLRIAYCVLCCMLYWTVLLERRAQMNGTAIPWRIFFFYCQPKGWKTTYRRAKWYCNSPHLNWNYRSTAWKKSSNVNPNVPLREVFCQNCPDSDHQDMSMCIFQPLTVGCLDTGLEKVMSSSPGQVDFLLSSVGYWYPIKHYVRALRLLITHLPSWSQEWLPVTSIFS